MKLKLISLIISFSIILGAGGYDHGTAAGKGNWDISLTWNLFNYFEQGQSYAILGYGLTEKIDIHAYYSSIKKDGGNLVMLLRVYKNTSASFLMSPPPF